MSAHTTFRLDLMAQTLGLRVATIFGQSSALGRRGKYAYTTPEAVKKEPVDHRSDLFSLGTLV